MIDRVFPHVALLEQFLRSRRVAHVVGEPNLLQLSGEIRTPEDLKVGLRELTVEC